MSDFGFDLDKLARLTARPEIWDPGDASFWVDPHIGRHVLEAHLDPDTEQASRNPATIDASVDWMIRRLGLDENHRLLDLGCGPGLYCSRFASAGIDVTGVDYAPVSVEYAARHHAGISFRQADYMEMDYDQEFDLITLIYGDLCVHSDQDRLQLLGRIHRALKPGGSFITDVFTRAYVLREGFESDWHVHQEEGFWHDGPHLVLEDAFHYHHRHLALDRYVVIDDAGEITRYHIWKNYYTPQRLGRVLKQAGFHVEGLFGDLQGTPYDPLSEWIGVVARRS